jgi:hypothetical protein
MRTWGLELALAWRSRHRLHIEQIWEAPLEWACVSCIKKRTIFILFLLPGFDPSYQETRCLRSWKGGLSESAWAVSLVLEIWSLDWAGLRLRDLALIGVDVMRKGNLKVFLDCPRNSNYWNRQWICHFLLSENVATASYGVYMALIKLFLCNVNTTNTTCTFPAPALVAWIFVYAVTQLVQVGSGGCAQINSLMDHVYMSHLNPPFCSHGVLLVQHTGQDRSFGEDLLTDVASQVR